MQLMTYTPMPQHLDHLLQKLVKEAGDPSANASNTVFVFREVLGQAYAAGHKDGHGQVMGQQWLVEDLHAAFAARRANQQAAAPAPQDDQDNFGG